MTELHAADPAIISALERLDGSGSDGELLAAKALRARVGDRLPELLLEKYRRSSRAPTRSACVYHSTPYARKVPAAVQLGLEALADRAKIVRYGACKLLAYSLRKDVIGNLKQALLQASADFREDIAAAIDAIESENHNYFVDRAHSGMVILNIPSV